MFFCCCRYTKPQSFADCTGNELPLGWEEAFDPQVGPYYINHVNRKYFFFLFVHILLRLFSFHMCHCYCHYSSFIKAYKQVLSATQNLDHDYITYVMSYK